LVDASVALDLCADPLAHDLHDLAWAGVTTQ
jgi:hypothetical protein